MSEQARMMRGYVSGRSAGLGTRDSGLGRASARGSELVPGAKSQVPAVIAVGAGKGGVGTSTVAALLAATMATDDRRVLLVDAGARFGGLHLLLGVEPSRSMESLRGGAAEPEELVVPIAPALSLLPGGVSPESVALTPAERRLLFRRVVALYPRYDVVVVDAGSTLDTVSAACADGVGRFLVVTGADRIAVVATYALVKALHTTAPDLGLEILPNRYDDETASRAHEHVRAAAERFLGRAIPLAGAIPDDPLFASALAAGMGAIEAADGSSAALAMHRIGERLVAELTSPATRRPGSTPARGSLLRLQP